MEPITKNNEANKTSEVHKPPCQVITLDPEARKEEIKPAASHYRFHLIRRKTNGSDEGFE